MIKQNIDDRVQNQLELDMNMQIHKQTQKLT